MAEHPADPEKIRWRWVFLCTILGGALIGAAFSVQTKWNWTGVAPSTLVDCGAALLLAATVFFFERAFMRNAAAAGAWAARTAIEQMQETVEQRVAEKLSREDAIVDAIKDEVSFESIAEAMRLANLKRAIPDGSVVIQAGRQQDTVRLLVSCIEYRDSRGPVIEITPFIGNVVPRPGASHAHDRISWRETETAAEAFSRLSDQLRQGRNSAVAELLDWTVAVGELQRTIGAAVRLRRARALRGRLRELVGTDWAITDLGIENIEHPGFLVPGLVVPARKQDRETWQPERPDWATDDDQWRRVVERAREFFPESMLERALRYVARDRRTWHPWVEEAA